MRTMICECLPNYAGDATIACVPGKIRTRSFLLFSVETCLFTDGMCQTTFGERTTKLRQSCVLAVDKQIGVICESDSQCTPDMACLNRRCINPCTVNPCAPNAECHIENHRRTCQCPRGHVGDPFVNCYEGTVSMSFLPFSSTDRHVSLALFRPQKT